MKEMLQGRKGEGVGRGGEKVCSVRGGGRSRMGRGGKGGSTGRVHQHDGQQPFRCIFLLDENKNSSKS